jgi:hypothetical protein
MEKTKAIAKKMGTGKYVVSIVHSQPYSEKPDVFSTRHKAADGDAIQKLYPESMKPSPFLDVPCGA